MKQKREISRYLLAMLLLLTIAITAGCGGGGGGGGDGGGGGGPTPLATGTFTKTADLGGTSWSGLLTTAPYVHFQYLYLASNINGSGMITGLAIKYNSAVATAVTCPNTTINLSHSNLANLTNTFANNLGTGQGGQTTVLNNATMTFPAGAAGSWQTISLATPFNYNGKDNLIIDVVRTSACSANVPDNVNSAGWPYTAVNFTFTNGSTTGLTDTWTANGRLIFAGGDNAVIAADRGGNNGNFFAPASQGRAQFLILASDIAGSGPVTGIQFTADAALAAPMTATYKVTLSHVAPATTTIGSTTFATNVGTNATVVAQAVSVSLPIGTTEWWTPLTGSFSYDGTSNLLVDVEATAVTGGFIIRYQNISGNRIMAGADPVAATGFLYPRGLEPKLRFNGGTMDVMTNEVGSSGQVLGGIAAGGQIQSLYRSAELGTGGTITSVSVRLRNDSVATSLTNYKLYIGNTIKTIYNIADSYASNMDENALVFSGTLNVPGGLKAGDWVTIPLSSPFVYDSNKNLSVLFTTDVGSVGNNSVRAGVSATQYPTRSVGRNDNAGTIPSWTYNGIVEVRFGISK